jgi:hypothetical protein
MKRIITALSTIMALSLPALALAALEIEMIKK